MSDIIREFSEINLDGALVQNLEIIPLKKISLRMMAFPTASNPTASGEIYDLQFNRVVDFDLETDGTSLRITGQKVFKDSEFLETVRTRPKKFAAKIYPERLQHFRIEFDDGRLDVIAESFSCVLLWET